jgi:zinc-ribbon domain
MPDLTKGINLPKVQPPKLGRPAASNGGASKQRAAESLEDRELRAERDRLLEKFTIMQADLGGAFYEMAIRDHVKLDVLTRKAAELQRIDIELTELEEKLARRRSQVSEGCPNCGSEYAPGARFCSQCGHELAKD